ncbi:hypothetical protein [Streptomyces tagetis]|uniref:hypothetical protein n=1 Tax=Streptomyces tagetis TaxID=2820809 RepID=UPI001B3706A4|nr:hypothetical protein [Streptomyces sp. RG38]
MRSRPLPARLAVGLITAAAAFAVAAPSPALPPPAGAIRVTSVNTPAAQSASSAPAAAEGAAVTVGATAAPLAVHPGADDDRALFRAVVDDGHGPSATSTPAVFGVASDTGGLRPVAHASLEWGVNAIYQGGNPANSGCNFFSAGTQQDFRAVQGDVRIIHRFPDGSAQGVSDATKCVPGTGSQLNQRVLFTHGTGKADATTGEATVDWTGAFTANAYSGMVTWYLKDPTLTVAEDGTGTLTATGGGIGADPDNPADQEEIPERRVTVATFERVRVDSTADPAGGVRITPDYAGVDYFPLVDGVRSTTSAIPAGVKKSQPDWGSWPQSFVDFQYETGLSSYWHTSGGGADRDKPPYDLAVRFDSAPDVRNVPVILANPSTTAAAPYVEGRDLTVTAEVDGEAALQWERAASANGPWSPIAGATGESLVIPAIDSSWNGGHVRIVATNADGRAVSTALRLTTAPYAAPSFPEPPRDLAAIQGTSAVVKFRAAGNPALAPDKMVLERSDDRGATWKPWSGARFAQTGGAQQFTVPAIPLDTDGARARVVAVNTEGTRAVSEPFSVRVFPATGKPQLVVLPDKPLDPDTTTRLTVLGAGFQVPDWASPTLTYSLDVGLFDSTVWQPGRTGTRDWVATSPDSSNGQIYHAPMQASGGTFTLSLTVPAGKLDPRHDYGIGAFLRLTDITTWRDTFDDRSLDAWTPVRLLSAQAEGEQTITATVPEQAGEFTWTIDAGDRAVTLTDAVNKGAYLHSTGDLKPVKVTDTRAGAPAWSVSGQVGDFTGGLSGKYLGWTPQVLTAGAGAQPGTAVAPGIDNGDGLTASATLGSATTGHAKGTGTLGAALDLRLPATTEAGTYTTTLTLTALS